MEARGGGGAAGESGGGVGVRGVAVCEDGASVDQYLVDSCSILEFGGSRGDPTGWVGDQTASMGEARERGILLDLWLRFAGDAGAVSGVRNGEVSMRRRLFNGAAFLSAVVFLLLGVLWPLTFRRSDRVECGVLTTTANSFSRWTLAVITDSGRAAFVAERYTGRLSILPLEPAPKRFFCEHHSGSAGDILHFKFTVAPRWHYIDFQGGTMPDFGYAVVPMWFPMVVAMMLPRIWLRRRRAGKRQRLEQTSVASAFAEQK